MGKRFVCSDVVLVSITVSQIYANHQQSGMALKQCVDIRFQATLVFGCGFL